MTTDPHIGDRVFVYGTLRRGFINNDATLAFRDGATFITEGTLAGALYSVGWYPALIEGEEGEVHGEVWQITAPGIMHILDDYEGLFDDGPPEYKRARRMISTPNGQVEAWGRRCCLRPARLLRLRLRSLRDGCGRPVRRNVHRSRQRRRR